jgi:hypothetical protein
LRQAGIDLIFNIVNPSVSRRKEDTMAEVKWIKDMEAALSLAKSEGKPLLLDFFNPN